MYSRIKWTVVRYKPPEGMTLNGDGVGGVKVKLMAKIAPKDDGSIVSFDVHLGGPALFGPHRLDRRRRPAGRHQPIAGKLRHGLRRADPSTNGGGGAHR